MKKLTLIILGLALLPLNSFAADLSKEDCIALMIVPELIYPGMKSLDVDQAAQNYKKIEQQDDVYNKAKMAVYKEGGCTTAFTELQELINAKLKK
jgi:hypothetical protein